MASNDWKAELKKRIEDIKEKKEQDRKAGASASKPSIKQEVQKSIANAQKKKEAKAPAQQQVARKTPPSAPAENKDPEPWPKTRHNVKKSPVTKPAKPKPEPKTEPKKEMFLDLDSPEKSEDQLFQMDDEISESSKADQDAIREQEIRKALANASGKKKKKRSQDETLFPVEPDDDETYHVEQKRQRIKVSELDFVEEKTENPQQQAQTNTSQEPSIEDSLKSLDRLMDSYTPVSPPEPEDDEEPLIQASTNIEGEEYLPQKETVPQDRPGLSKPIIVDKTHQHRNLLRIGAGLTDAILLLSFEALLIWIASMILKTTPLNVFFQSMLPLGGLFLVLHFIYYMLFMSITGQTPGKSLFQLKVVNKHGNSMGFGRALLRWILQIISLAPAALGFFFMFVSPQGHTFYDMVLGTKLIRKAKEE